jgi:hypothetical protein
VFPFKKFEGIMEFRIIKVKERVRNDLQKLVGVCKALGLLNYEADMFFVTKPSQKFSNKANLFHILQISRY